MRFFETVTKIFQILGLPEAATRPNKVCCVCLWCALVRCVILFLCVFAFAFVFAFTFAFTFCALLLVLLLVPHIHAK